MSNGNPYIPDKHDDVLRAWAGRATAAEIAAKTGHCERTIGVQLKRLGLAAFHPKRVGLSRRDRLLLGAAGLTENATCA